MSGNAARRLHILGVCGTFMGGIALLARERGQPVSGTDAGAWPPMSGLLAHAGIEVREGYSAEHLFGTAPARRPDEVVVGNALSRGNAAVEAMLDDGVPYTSGPEWLAREVLPGRRVLAVAGTHGKTTTAALCTWILLRSAPAEPPGWLIGGAPGWTERSASLGRAAPFVVEGDEYDTAFFDKRAKLVHYRPHVLILNNLEYDHADIYPDLASIARQLHHAVRTVPSTGRLIVNGDDPELPGVLDLGAWTPVERVGKQPHNDWRYEPEEHGDRLFHQGEPIGPLRLPMVGNHNRANAAAAVAATAALGVAPTEALDALAAFPGVRRRLELRGSVDGIRVIDDFAHHPTAIAATLDALRQDEPTGRVLAVLEPRSNTMRMGVHHNRLADALSRADAAFVLDPEPEAPAPGRLAEALSPLGDAVTLRADTRALIDAIVRGAEPGDRIVVMSNGGFEGLHQRLLDALRSDPTRTGDGS